jgi:hypothetical protein
MSLASGQYRAQFLLADLALNQLHLAIPIALSGDQSRLAVQFE